MSPAEISLLTTLISLLTKMSGWPFGLMLFIALVGPWVLALLIASMYHRRFERVVKMYENNVVLVENYEKLANELSGVIHLNTQVQTKLVEQIKSNMYCPIVRERGPHA